MQKLENEEEWHEMLSLEHDMAIALVSSNHGYQDKVKMVKITAWIVGGPTLIWGITAFGSC